MLCWVMRRRKERNKNLAQVKSLSRTCTPGGMIGTYGNGTHESSFVMVCFGSVRFFAADGVGRDVSVIFFVGWLLSFGRDAPLLQPIRVWVDCVALVTPVRAGLAVLPSPYI